MQNRDDEYKDLLLLPAAQKVLGDWGELPQIGTPPDFPESALPIIGRDMAAAVAEAVQVPVGMAACFLLGALSTATVGKASVIVREGYSEPIQLYMAVSAMPSERKSACLTAMFAPLHEFLNEENTRLASEAIESAAVRAMLDKQLQKVQMKGDDAEVRRLSHEIADFVDVQPVELILSDATTEAMAARMAQNGGRLAIVSAEGGVLNILAGMYSQSGVNLDVILHGYSGEPISSARIGRTCPRIEKAALSITLAVQPAILEKFVGNETLLGCGAVARFLLASPPSLLGSRKIEGYPVPKHITARYSKRITELMQAQEITLALSPDALAVFNGWVGETEKRLGIKGDLREVGAGWGGKLCGNTARIAGLLTLLADEGFVIGSKRMQAAVTIAQYFAAQMLSLTGADMGLSQNAHELLKFLKEWQAPEFSPAVVRRKLRNRKRFEKGDVFDAALLELANSGYLRAGKQPEWNGVGRPPEAHYTMHPALLLERPAEVIEL